MVFLYLGSDDDTASEMSWSKITGMKPFFIQRLLGFLESCQKGPSAVRIHPFFVH